MNTILLCACLFLCFLWAIFKSCITLFIMFFLPKYCVSLGSSVAIMCGYGLDDRTLEVRYAAGAKIISCSFCVQTGFGAHPASCTMDTGGPFPWGKARPGLDADYSPHLVPRSWISRSYNPLPPPCVAIGVLFNLATWTPMQTFLSNDKKAQFSKLIWSHKTGDRSVKMKLTHCGDYDDPKSRSPFRLFTVTI
jgi:hypothetical protein